MPCGGLTKRGLAGDVGRGKTKFKVLNYLKLEQIRCKPPNVERVEHGHGI